MSDLLTPAELAEIAEREAKATKGPWMLRHDGWTIRDSKGERQIAHTYGRDGSFVEQQVSDAEFIAEARTDIPALLRHIAALDTLVEVVKPAPAKDVDALLAKAERHIDILNRGVGDSMFASCINDLATALRESRAREVAEPYRHALEQRLICSNLPLLTGDADADLMRFVFHEQELALSPEAGVIAELKEQRDTALSWTATYTNMDVYRRCLAAAIARAEKAEAEREEERAAHDAIASICHEAEVDGGDGTSIRLVRVLVADLAAAIARADKAEAERDAALRQRDNNRQQLSAAYARQKDIEADLAAARAELGALREVEWEWRATDSHYWDACPHCNGKKNCGRVGKHRAIRVVKEATEAAELQAMQDAIEARANQIRTAMEGGAQ